MDVAIPNNQALKDILTEKKSLNFEFLAIQIFVTREKKRVKEDPSSLDASVKAFSDLLSKYRSSTAVIRDIEKMV